MSVILGCSSNEPTFPQSVVREPATPAYFPLPSLIPVMRISAYLVGTTFNHLFLEPRNLSTIPSCFSNKACLSRVLIVSSVGSTNLPITSLGSSFPWLSS